MKIFSATEKYDEVQYSFIKSGSYQINLVASFDKLTFRSLLMTEKQYYTVPNSIFLVEKDLCKGIDQQGDGNG